MKFNKWCNSLASQLDITPESRFMVNLTDFPYNYCFSSSFTDLSFTRRHGQYPILDVDHISVRHQLCFSGQILTLARRCVAAENIMGLFATWQELYGLRNRPITLMQIAFSAGTALPCKLTRVAIVSRKIFGTRWTNTKLSYNICKRLDAAGQALRNSGATHRRLSDPSPGM